MSWRRGVNSAESLVSLDGSGRAEVHCLIGVSALNALLCFDSYYIQKRKGVWRAFENSG